MILDVGNVGNVIKECDFIKMDNKKKLLLMEKLFASKRLLKLIIFKMFPASKSSIIGNYSTKKRCYKMTEYSATNPGFKIFGYNVMRF